MNTKLFDDPFLLKSPNARQPPKAQPGHPQIQHLQFKMQSEADDACGKADGIDVMPKRILGWSWC